MECTVHLSIVTTMMVVVDAVTFDIISVALITLDKKTKPKVLHLKYCKTLFLLHVNFVIFLCRKFVAFSFGGFSSCISHRGSKTYGDGQFKKFACIQFHDSTQIAKI